jgi:hypothetical protein
MPPPAVSAHQVAAAQDPDYFLSGWHSGKGQTRVLQQF